MTTKSDDGEKTCPLCAEEMDITDQQLKPCKCGYEMCVWCWNHIIDMAEKDASEGKCPACRTPYDKERIVGSAANRQGLVSGVDTDRKLKSQKGKLRMPAETRKQLSSVRVVQRNLVYIIGLPLTIADESVLEQREYFGQYGKVLKISISRPSGETQQASFTNTFSVYITYAKEEEAVRCIQAVHNFVLEGKTLRAYFGTTKYCHSWLRNMTCSNPDCFYLHEIGSEEDSFAKDEIVSAYTRSRVPLAPNNLQHRVGYVLPSPVDDFYNNGSASTAKIATKDPLTNSTTHLKCSPPKSSITTRTTGLPAAASWGSRVPQSSSVSSPCIQVPSEQKQETPYNSPLVSSTKLISVQDNMDKARDSKCKPSEPPKVTSDGDSQTTVSNSSAAFSCTKFSAWRDDVDLDTTLKMPEDDHRGYQNGKFRPVSKSHLSRELHTTVSDLSEGIAPMHITSAWDDDEDDTVTAQKIRKENRKPLSSSGISGHSSSLNSRGREPETDVFDMPTKAASAVGHTSELPLHVSNPTSSAGLGHTEKYCVPDNSASLQDDDDIKKLDMETSVCDRGDIRAAISKGSLESICSGLSLVNSHDISEVRHEMNSNSKSDSSYCLLGSSNTSVLQIGKADCQFGFIDSPLLSKSTTPIDSFFSRDTSNLTSEFQKQALASVSSGLKVAVVGSNDRRDGHDNIVAKISYAPSSVQVTSVTNQSSLWDSNYQDSCLSVDSRFTGMRIDEASKSLGQGDIIVSNENHESKFCSLFNYGTSSKFNNKISSEEKDFDRFASCSHVRSADSGNNGENSIISNILSMDFDPWSDSLTATSDFVKLLRQTSSQNFSLCSSLKPPNSNQSRFSFARQENDTSYLESTSSDLAHAQFRRCGTSQAPVVDSLGNGVRTLDMDYSVAFAYSQPVISSDKMHVSSKGKTSAPSGFSVPSTPPGFSSHNVPSQIYNPVSSANQFPGSSSMANDFQVLPNESSDDVEFIDPAILKVIKGGPPIGVPTELGLRSFSSQINPSGTDPRFQLLMQQTIPTQQSHMVDSILHLNNGFAPSWLMQQNFSSSSFGQIPLHLTGNSYIPSNQWDSWSDNQSRNDIVMNEMLRNERLALNSYFPGNEEIKFNKATSSNLYSQAYGM